MGRTTERELMGAGPTVRKPECDLPGTDLGAQRVRDNPVVRCLSKAPDSESRTSLWCLTDYL